VPIDSNRWTVFVWLSIGHRLTDTNRYQWTNFMDWSIGFPIVDFHWLDIPGFCLSAASSRQRHDILGFCLLFVVMRFACHIGQSATIFEFHLKSLPCVFSRRSVNQSVALLYFLLLHCADETQPGRNSCPRLQFLAFSVVFPLSFLRSNQPCFIVMFLFLADEIFYRSYLNRQHFRLRSLASFYLQIYPRELQYELPLAYNRI